MRLGVESADLIEKLLELVKSTLESGEDVLISGFGKFCVHERGPRKGRNPQSGGDLSTLMQDGSSGSSRRGY